jgi:hypothetical protein
MWFSFVFLQALLLGRGLNLGTRIKSAVTQAADLGALRPATSNAVTQAAVKEQLLRAIKRRQSIPARIGVEKAIQDLIALRLPVKPLQPGVYRTVWTSVSSDSFLGAGTSPASILGGSSYQVIDKSFKMAENVVIWRLGGFVLRMVGSASISPIKREAKYALTIRGLEFRWGVRDKMSPEQKGLLGEAAILSGSKFTALSLLDGESLRNGVGTLDLLYFDGRLRISKDEKTGITYIHDKNQI